MLLLLFAWPDLEPRNPFLTAGARWFFTCPQFVHVLALITSAVSPMMRYVLPGSRNHSGRVTSIADANEPQTQSCGYGLP